MKIQFQWAIVPLGILLLSMQGSKLAKANNSSRNFQGQTVGHAENNPESNKAVIRKLYEEILNYKKLELLPSVVSEAYVGPSGERGAAGITATIQGLLVAFPDIQWTIQELIAEGSKVVVRWSWKGNHTGTFRGIAPTQKLFTNEAIAIYELSDGKIVKAWLQSDRLGFVQQMGLVDPELFKKK